MEKSVKSKMAKRSFDELISAFSENEILKLDALRSVRGGDGDGGADSPIIPPKIN